MSSFYFSYTANFYRLTEGVNLRCNGRFTHSKINVGIFLRQVGVYEPLYEFSSRSGFIPGFLPSCIYTYPYDNFSPPHFFVFATSFFLSPLLALFISLSHFFFLPSSLFFFSLSCLSCKKLNLHHENQWLRP